MLKTALKAGVGCIQRRAVTGSVPASVQAGSRALSSLQESLVKVTFIDAEVLTIHALYIRMSAVSLVLWCIDVCTDLDIPHTTVCTKQFFHRLAYPFVQAVSVKRTKVR